tara:strand:- start:2120 stop:2566 length:447 start_codon:yes stop_codon:yes gene_type:complete
MARNRGLGDRATEMALDAAGTADPTGIVDIAHAAKLASQGRFTDAALTAVGVIPYIGDTAKLAKYAKYAKHAKTVRKVSNAPGLSGIKDSIDGRIGQGIQNAQAKVESALPGGATNALAMWRAQNSAKKEVGHDSKTPQHLLPRRATV